MGEGRKTMWYKQNTALFIQEGRWIRVACRKMDRAGEHRDKWTVRPYRHIQTFSGIQTRDWKWHEQRRENVAYLGIRTGRWDMGVKHDQHVWKCHNETILYNACRKKTLKVKSFHFFFCNSSGFLPFEKANFIQKLIVHLKPQVKHFILRGFIRTRPWRQRRVMVRKYFEINVNLCPQTTYNRACYSPGCLWTV